MFAPAINKTCPFIIHERDLGGINDIDYPNDEKKTFFFLPHDLMSSLEQKAIIKVLPGLRGNFFSS